VRGEPGTLRRPHSDRLEKQIDDAVRSWEDKLLAALFNEYSDEQARTLYNAYCNAFSAAYKEDVDPSEVPADIVLLEELEAGADIVTSLGKPKATWLQHEGGNGRGATRLRFKIFRSGHYIAISDILPILENMGLRVVAERPYEVHRSDGRSAWIQDVDMKLVGVELEDLSAVEKNFRDAVAGVWRGVYESDRFNRLVLFARFTPAYTMLLRAYGKYLLQTGLPFSRQYMAGTLSEYPHIASALIDFFRARFDPDFPGNRATAMTRRYKAIREMLESVRSLDADRILRAFTLTIRATLRTNFYQKENPNSVAFKLDPAVVPDLPLPLPMYEIFVYSPRFEAIHLRKGKVARGGIRWSNRPEDFRTEVLGLMKAQQVKNSVIVPVGAKGGFVVKTRLTGTREEQQQCVRRCYADFLRGMLDITDNRAGDGIQPPKRCVRHDGDDPYLVVAADKGTATFSDLANEISAEYGFWLADAFASGGSVGYDHKKMGITAKGAWESVKRHFRELGRDCRRSDFTAVGIGDMSGDVFGNGMLLSRHTRLIAAFNHLHIFIDPNPDHGTSHAERRRLFRLSQSGWDDYRRELISSGGGVYSRHAKSITLTEAAAQALGTERGEYTPQDLIRAILRAPVDLLWNGGIGTYVKASHERNRDVGDRAHDPVRVDGRELRCLIVGEGGNLGFTQAGRVEFAGKGGRINTDFIDNSGGVDCSDREVNIKILLQAVTDRAGLSQKKRNQLFLNMKADVEAQVLRDNYLQAQALSFVEYHSIDRLNEHAQLIRSLERSSALNRSLEGLPDEDGIAELRKSGKGLSRPELAVLLAYAKNELYGSLLSSDVADDSWLGRELALYFPEALRDTFADAMQTHRLRDELICTSISNSVVNRMGPSFSRRMCDDTGATHAEVARAFAVAREVYQVKAAWEAIEAADSRLAASVQMRMLERLASLLRNATRRLLQRADRNQAIQQDVDRYTGTVEFLRSEIGNLLPAHELQSLEDFRSELEGEGVAGDLALIVAQSPFLYSALDITHIAERGQGRELLPVVTQVYFDLARHIPLEWLRTEIEGLPVEGHWQSVARGTLRENYFRYRSELTSRIMQEVKKTGDGSPVDGWIREHNEEVSHVTRVFGEIRATGNADYAAASVAVQEIGRLAEARP
ncbi:MAG: NAD-glutamate dehydrogenase, partial [Spirochaetota bacterium]